MSWSILNLKEKEMQKEIVRNSLSMQQALKLSFWLSAKKDHTDWKNLSVRELIPMAVKDLGFNIVERNLRSVAKASSIVLPTKREKSVDPSSKNYTRHKIGLLKKGLVELYHRLGEALPDYLEFDN